MNRVGIEEKKNRRMEEIVNSKKFFKLDKINPSKEDIFYLINSLSHNYDGIQFLSNIKEIDHKEDLFIDLIKIPNKDQISVYVNYKDWKNESDYEKIEVNYIPIVNLQYTKIRLDYKDYSYVICYTLKSDIRKETMYNNCIRESNTSNIFYINGYVVKNIYRVYIKLFSGEIIPFYCNINDTLKELAFKISAELNVEIAQILFFEEYEPIKNLKVNIKNEFVYDVFIKDFVVKISFDRTIRINHKYTKMPKRAILEIVNLTDNAYRYIYNELYYVSRGDGDFFLNRELFNFDTTEEEHLFINLLRKYDIEPFPDDKDFSDIDEKTKLNLISAYLFECVSISLDIISHVFITI